MTFSTGCEEPLKAVGRVGQTTSTIPTLTLKTRSLDRSSSESILPIVCFRSLSMATSMIMMAKAEAIGRR